jgi:hypothetical protein
VLETLRKVDAVVLDKTGTIPEGNFPVLDFEVCTQEEPAAFSLQCEISSRASPGVCGDGAGPQGGFSLARGVAGDKPTVVMTAPKLAEDRKKSRLFMAANTPSFLPES